MPQMKLKVGIKNLRPGMNILDIKVPNALRQKRASGISWFDSVLGGEGFTPSTSIMLTGTPGAGKTTMMLQLADSLTKSGHVVLFNTGEESLYQVKLTAERLRLQNGFVCGQDTYVEEIIKHAKKLQRNNPSKQVFILQDSLQTCDDGKYANGTNGSSSVRSCEMLTDWAKETMGVVIFIGQVTKDGSFAGKNAIKHTVDVHLHLEIDREKKSETFGERVFEAQKNRFGCSGLAFVLGMEKNGLYEKQL